MNTDTYIINIVLVLLVVRQIRERRLDLRGLLLPVALVAVAGFSFLHTIPTAGNDLILVAVLATAGAAMGVACALATHVRLGNDGTPLARAGRVAAALWIAGVGARMAFAYGSAHGLGPTIAWFSREHAITSASAWVAALVLMALADVTTRLLVLYARGRRLSDRRAPLQWSNAPIVPL
jgi:hypothetical protein